MWPEIPNDPKSPIKPWDAHDPRQKPSRSIETKQIKRKENTSAKSSDPALENIKAKFRINLKDNATYWYNKDFDENEDGVITFDEFLKIDDSTSQYSILHELNKLGVLSTEEICIVLEQLSPEQNGEILYQYTANEELIRKFAEKNPEKFIEAVKTQCGFSRRCILGQLGENTEKLILAAMGPTEEYENTSTFARIKKGFKFFLKDSADKAIYKEDDTDKNGVIDLDEFLKSEDALNQAGILDRLLNEGKISLKVGIYTILNKLPIDRLGLLLYLLSDHKNLIAKFAKDEPEKFLNALKTQNSTAREYILKAIPDMRAKFEKELSDSEESEKNTQVVIQTPQGSVDVNGGIVNVKVGDGKTTTTTVESGKQVEAGPEGVKKTKLSKVQLLNTIWWNRMMFPDLSGLNMEIGEKDNEKYIMLNLEDKKIKYNITKDKYTVIQGTTEKTADEKEISLIKAAAEKAYEANKDSKIMQLIYEIMTAK